MKFFKLNRDKSEKYTDEELLGLYKETGDSQFFGILYNRYLPLIYGVCLKYLEDEHRSQDATMEIFENLLSKIINYDIKVFKTWLYSVVKNHCFHILKNNKQEIITDLETNIITPDIVLSVLEAEEVDLEREDALNYCMAKLSEPQRLTLNKFFYENLSYADIVDATNFDLKSVKSYIQNGKRNLKLCIENRLNIKQ